MKKITIISLLVLNLSAVSALAQNLRNSENRNVDIQSMSKEYFGYNGLLASQANSDQLAAALFAGSELTLAQALYLKTQQYKKSSEFLRYDYAKKELKLAQDQLKFYEHYFKMYASDVDGKIDANSTDKLVVSQQMRSQFSFDPDAEAKFALAKKHLEDSQHKYVQAKEAFKNAHLSKSMGSKFLYKLAAIGLISDAALRANEIYHNRAHTFPLLDLLNDSGTYAIDVYLDNKEQIDDMIESSKQDLDKILELL